MNVAADRRRRARAARLVAWLAVLAASVAITPDALAAPPSRAARLFEEGKVLLSRGQVAEACAMLEESDRAEPSVGTLGLLAACLERQGKLASAWAAYLETAARAAREGDDRGPYAADRARALEARLPRLVLAVEGAAVAEVTVGTRRLGPDQLGVPVFVDPGPTAVEAVASDGRRVARTIDAQPGESMRVELTFEARPPSPPDVGDAALGPAAHDPAAEPGFPIWPGLAALGVGVAGLTVMGVFGGVAMGENASSEDLARSCATSGSGCEEGRADREDAADAATVATAGLVVGAAGVAAAAVLLVIHAGADDEPAGGAEALRIAPSVSWDGAGLDVRGAF